jgi:hypothetical protein
MINEMLCGMTEAFWKKCIHRTKSGTFARRTKPTLKANLAKEPGLFPRFLDTPKLLDTYFIVTHSKEGRTYNKGFGVIGAGRC